MSIESTAAVRRLHKNGVVLDPRDRFVLYALADYANDEHQAWPSFATLQDFTGYDRRTIIRALASLEDAGLVTSEARTRDNGSRTSNRYHLAFVKAGWQPDTPPVSQGHPPGVSVTPPPVAQRHPLNYQIEPPVEPPKENTSLAVASRPQPDLDQALVDIYNEHRGALPAAQALNPTRRRALARLRKEAGENAEAMLAAATMVVARDAFWIERRYGLDNLLRDGRVTAKAEIAADRFTTPGDARLATTASAIANAIGGLG